MPTKRVKELYFSKRAALEGYLDSLDEAIDSLESERVRVQEMIDSLPK